MMYDDSFTREPTRGVIGGLDAAVSRQTHSPTGVPSTVTAVTGHWVGGSGACAQWPSKEAVVKAASLRTRRWQTSGSPSIHRRARRPTWRAGGPQQSRARRHRNPVLARIRRHHKPFSWASFQRRDETERSRSLSTIGRARSFRLGCRGGNLPTSGVRCDPPSYPYTDRLLLHGGENT